MTELNLLAYLIKNPFKYEACHHHLKDLRLESPPLQTVWSCLEGAFSTYGRFPTVSEAEWLISRTVKDSQAVKDLTQLSNCIYNTEVTGVSGELLSELLIQSEKQKLADLLTSDNVRMADLIKVQDRIAELQTVLNQEERTYFSPFELSKIQNPFQTLEAYWGKPIPFGNPEWDSRWLQGGGRLGELITLIGLTGGGKSILLLWWALYQAQQGYFVAYFSFDNVVGELLSRLWCASSGVLMDQMELTPESEFARRLIQYSLENFPGIVDRLLVQKWPRGTRTVRDIEMVIDQMEADKGRELDVVYVDYGDCVRAKDSRKDVRFQLDEVFSDLGALAEEYNIMVVTATQANRAAKYLEFLDIDSAAEAWQKAWHSAIVMGLCQSKLEKSQGRAKIVVGKARRVRSDYVVPILMDPNNMRALPDPDHKIEFRAVLENNTELEVKKAKSRGVVKGASSGATPGELPPFMGTIPEFNSIDTWDKKIQDTFLQGLDIVQSVNNFPSPLAQQFVMPTAPSILMGAVAE